MAACNIDECLTQPTTGLLGFRFMLLHLLSATLLRLVGSGACERSWQRSRRRPAAAAAPAAARRPSAHWQRLRWQPLCRCLSLLARAQTHLVRPQVSKVLEFAVLWAEPARESNKTQTLWCECVSAHTACYYRASTKEWRMRSMSIVHCGCVACLWRHLFSSLLCAPSLLPHQHALISQAAMPQQLAQRTP